jgi:predicted transcriptional regulator
LNEILKENKKIENINLQGNYNITSKGINFLKESLKTNQFLKEISFPSKS